MLRSGDPQSGHGALPAAGKTHPITPQTEPGAERTGILCPPCSPEAYREHTWGRHRSARTRGRSDTSPARHRQEPRRPAAGFCAVHPHRCGSREPRCARHTRRRCSHARGSCGSRVRSASPQSTAEGRGRDGDGVSRTEPASICTATQPESYVFYLQTYLREANIDIISTSAAAGFGFF